MGESMVWGEKHARYQQPNDYSGENIEDDNIKLCGVL